MKKSEIQVLIIDDEIRVRNSLSEAITKFGYKAVTASNVDEALNVVKIQPIHAAIVDCMLPKMNGIDLVAKMRQSRFRDSVVFLMSGIFKDRSFASDAIKKTDAIEFLYKPLNLLVLKEKLEDSLNYLLTETTVPLHSLLSKGYESARERRKAIEMLESVSGFDLPFVTSTLLDANVGGHLNLVNSAGEIYGITIVDGKIIKVDSSEAVATLTLALIQEGYITGKDLEDLGDRAKRGDILKNLVEEALISPHVVSVIRKKQIIGDLRRLFIDEIMQINFVPDRKIEKEDGVSLDELTDLLNETTDKSLTVDYLKNFYKNWMDYPIHKGPAFKDNHNFNSFGLIERAPGIMNILDKDKTINELLSENKYDENSLYKALHLLSLRRVLIFDTVKKGAGSENLQEKFEHMLAGIKNKNPVEIFEYFGAEKNPKASTVEKIYRDFAKNNHPDKLPAKSEEKLRELNNKIFSLISEAHDILTDESKRTEYFANLRQEEAQRQMKAEGIADKALSELRRGHPMKAYEKLKEAYELYKNGLDVMLYYTWAELKAFPSPSEEQINSIHERLNAVPHEERRIAYYQFVLGLLRRAQKDYVGASACFDKALSYDNGFLDARREQASLASEAGNQSSAGSNLLQADLGELVSGFFKKKK